jgi:hypothetical protein
MKTITPWMLGLSLCVLPFVSACDDDDDGNDSSNDDGGNDGGNDGGGDVGDQCMQDGDCSDYACIFAGDVDYGFCSTVCESFSDCPSFWNCENVGNASAKYCVPG